MFFKLKKLHNELVTKKGQSYHKKADEIRSWGIHLGPNSEQLHSSFNIFYRPFIPMNLYFFIFCLIKPIHYSKVCHPVISTLDPVRECITSMKLYCTVFECRDKWALGIAMI
jgi:hypothetical protein